MGESVSKTSPTDVGEAASSRTHFRTGPYHGGGYEQGGVVISEWGCIVARSDCERGGQTITVVIF